MKRNLILPGGLIVLAAVVGLVLMLVLAQDKPELVPTPDPNDLIAPDDRQPRDTRPAPVINEPDPVRNDRPEQPYEQQQSLPRLVLEGRVVDGAGVGIADAEIIFTGELALSGMSGIGFTGADGSYRFVAWSPSAEVRSASPERRGAVAARARDGGLGVSGSLEIPETDSFAVPDIVLAAGGTIEGEVVNAAGQPAPGARVTLQSSMPVQQPDDRGRVPGMVNRHVMRMVHADERGRFRVDRLPAATYRVTGDPGYWGLNTNAEILALEESRSAWVRVELRAENFIRGVVVDSLGMPVPGASVSIRVKPGDEGETSASPVGRPEPGGIRRFDEEPEGMALQITDVQGRFGFFNLSNADFEVAARLGGAKAVLESRVSEADLSITLAVAGGAFVSGTARDAETGRAITAFDVRVVGGSAEDADPFYRVAAHGAFPWRAGGEFRVVNVPEGDFQLRISAPGYVPLLLPVQALRESEQRAGLSAELKPLCEVRITPVHDGRRYDLEPVMLMYDSRIAYQASTNAAGQVRIPGVAPGSYELRLILQSGQVMKAQLEVPARRTAEVEVELTQ